MIRTLVLAGALAVAASSALAAPVRSDLPIWASAEAYPLPAGLSTRMARGLQPGDWRLRALDCDPDNATEECFTWVRIAEFAMLEHGLTVAEAPTREALKDASAEPAFFEVLPGAKTFTLQIGFRGGSHYLLLGARDARRPESFDVLNADCEEEGEATWKAKGYRERKIDEPAFFRSDYCVVGSPEGLAALAASSKASQAMEYVGAAEE